MALSELEMSYYCHLVQNYNLENFLSKYKPFHPLLDH